MTDVKRLLDEATALPWRWDGVMGGIRVDDHYVISGPGYRREPNGDERLIEYAVNRLPDYEAAVDALRRLLTNGPNHTNYEGCADGMPWPTDDIPDDVECDACQAVLAARRALHRLREQVPA